MINCGLIGVGKFGKNILKNLKRHKAIKDIYLCDTNISTNTIFESLPITPDYKSIFNNAHERTVIDTNICYKYSEQYKECNQNLLYWTNGYRWKLVNNEIKLVS